MASNYFVHTDVYNKFITETFKKTDIYDFRDIKYVLIPPMPILNKIWPTLFGGKLISGAYNDYGGTEKMVNKELILGTICLSTILRGTKQIDKDAYVEVRLTRPEYSVLYNLPYAVVYHRHELNLPLEWDNVPTSKRKSVHKASYSSFVISVDCGELDQIYDLYLHMCHEKGSPPLPFKFFDNFFKIIVSAGMGKVFCAYDRNTLKPISLLMGYTCGDRVQVFICANDSRYKTTGACDLVHWRFIDWANRNGYKYFDFGRSIKGSGAAEYKRRWGARVAPLRYIYSKNPILVDGENHRAMSAILRWTPFCIFRILAPRLRWRLGI